MRGRGRGSGDGRDYPNSNKGNPRGRGRQGHHSMTYSNDNPRRTTNHSASSENEPVDDGNESSVEVDMDVAMPISNKRKSGEGYSPETIRTRGGKNRKVSLEQFQNVESTDESAVLSDGVKQTYSRKKTKATGKPKRIEANYLLATENSDANQSNDTTEPADIKKVHLISTDDSLNRFVSEP